MPIGKNTMQDIFATQQMPIINMILNIFLSIAANSVSFHWTYKNEIYYIASKNVLKCLQ